MDFTFLDKVYGYKKIKIKRGDYIKSEHEVPSPKPLKRNKKQPAKVYDKHHSFPELLNKEIEVPVYTHPEFFTTEVGTKTYRTVKTPSK